MKNGNEVEFVPAMTFKNGLRFGYNNLKTSLLYSYTASQFSEATNAPESTSNTIMGLIPAYEIVDFSISYEYKRYKIEGSVNNLLDARYFTRRATGYPGPGILPSDGRTFYCTLQVKI